ncbi:GNAT family N-acetyltransferase [Longispora albida]|uniref:GNAT family N-acetyltransferase n=1 Tax=Longispora albida TaxID=203523 RepID=UPI0012FCDF74|nr:GNAT family N-acetyltransferase [Longispora albida]
MTAADIGDTARLHHRTWQDAYQGIVAAEQLAALTEESWIASYTRGLGTPGRITLVALTGDAIVGTATFGPDRKEPGYDEIYAIYVAPERQGHGVGRALMDAAVARLTTGEGRPVRLWVAAANASSRRFYELYGFTADGAADVWVRDEISIDVVRYVL